MGREELLEYFMIKPPGLAQAIARAREANQSSGLSEEHKGAGMELFMHLVKTKNQDKNRQLEPSPYLDIAMGGGQPIAINPDMFERAVSGVMKGSVGANSIKRLSKRVLDQFGDYNHEAKLMNLPGVGVVLCCVVHARPKPHCARNKETAGGGRRP